MLNLNESGFSFDKGSPIRKTVFNLNLMFNNREKNANIHFKYLLMYFVTRKAATANFGFCG